MAITTVLFDLDGTLINTNPLIIKTFEITLKHFFPAETFTKERILDFIGPTLVQTFDSLNKEKTNEMRAFYQKVTKELHDDMVDIYPTVKEGLKLLKDRNLNLGIVSSKRREMVIHGLKHCGIDNYFQFVIGADDVKNPKPDKEPIIKAMNIVKSRKEETIFVGDNSHDILGGKNAGVITCCVAWALRGADYLKQYQPDYILEDMSDLIQIIDEVNENGK